MSTRLKPGFLIPTLWLTAVLVFVIGAWSLGNNVTCYLVLTAPLNASAILLVTSLIAFAIGLRSYKGNAKQLQAAFIVLFALNVTVFIYLILQALLGGACALPSGYGLAAYGV